MTQVKWGLALTLCLAASPAAAVDLFEASGSWAGEGRLATGVNAPLERGRCRVTVTPGAGTVDVVGFCAVAAGRSDLSLKLVRGTGGAINAGVWTEAGGAVRQFAGRAAGGEIVLFSTAPLVIDGQRYDARVDVTQPDAARFAVRQLLRLEGASAWTLIGEMTYRPADG